MENKGLLFIPDISGFTRFVNETEIGHSQLIVKELLETLINANEIGLQVSEIEGDAILFYKFGESPSLAELYKQVEKMFCEFHRQLIVYDNTRYCYCKACNSATNLTLKIITHHGEFTGYNVKNFSNLFGKDVIVAHQLMKNDIVQHEYWLVTNNLLPGNRPPDELTNWMKWSSSAKQTETGEVGFHYTQLSELKNEITPAPMPQLEIASKSKLFSVSREYDTDIITLFHGSGDFNYRSRWQEGIKKVEEINHFLPRVGMKCRCILENGEVNIFSTSYFYNDDRIEFSETDEEKKSSVHFTLEKIRDKKTKLTLDYYVRKNPLHLLFKPAGAKKLEESFNQSLINLEEVVKEIKLPHVS